jgi:hypothetical protein
MCATHKKRKTKMTKVKKMWSISPLKFSTIWIISALLFFGACSSAKFIATGQSYPAKADDCDIQVFTSKQPDRDFEELGIIEGQGFLGADSFEDVLPKMKIEACRAGGDAIILISSQKTVDVSGHDDDVSSDDKLNVTATVIRWTD